MIAVRRTGPVNTPSIAIAITSVLRDRLCNSDKHPAAGKIGLCCSRQSTRWLNQEQCGGNNRYHQRHQRLRCNHIETSPSILGGAQSLALISINLSGLASSIERYPKCLRLIRFYYAFPPGQGRRPRRLLSRPPTFEEYRKFRMQVRPLHEPAALFSIREDLRRRRMGPRAKFR
jgi:hypothetical protein